MWWNGIKTYTWKMQIPWNWNLLQIQFNYVDFIPTSDVHKRYLTVTGGDFHINLAKRNMARDHKTELEAARKCATLSPWCTYGASNFWKAMSQSRTQDFDVLRCSSVRAGMLFGANLNLTIDWYRCRTMVVYKTACQSKIIKFLKIA